MTKSEVMVTATQLDCGWYGCEEGRKVMSGLLADGRRTSTLVVDAARMR